jgi:hypothetical protein
MRHADVCSRMLTYAHVCGMTAREVKGCGAICGEGARVGGRAARACPAGRCRPAGPPGVQYTPDVLSIYVSSYRPAVALGVQYTPGALSIICRHMLVTPICVRYTLGALAMNECMRHVYVSSCCYIWQETHAELQAAHIARLESEAHAHIARLESELQAYVAGDARGAAGSARGSAGAHCTPRF